MREHHLRIGDRDVILLEGPAGWGECSPLPGYPCDPALARAAAEEAAATGWPEPLRHQVAVNALVFDDAFDPEVLRRFPCVKVKVRDATDVDRVAKVRDAIGSAPRLRVDANGAWDVDTAVVMIERLAPYDLELVEQPVASIADLARLRTKVGVPIAADECIRTIDDARELARLGAADVIVLKQQPLGGVRAALDVAEVAGVPAVVTSMYETSIGLAAGVALAAALPELPFACGLATLDRIAADVVDDPVVPIGGVIPVRRRAPAPTADALARYEREIDS
jgi:O-succinylbenzoate synthase